MDAILWLWIFTFLGIIVVFLLIYLIIGKSREKDRIEYDNRIASKLRFERIHIGDTFDRVSNLFSNDEIDRKQISEELLNSKTKRAIYVWELPFDYEIGKSSGGGVAFMNGANYGNGIGYSSTNSTITSKAYIKVIFENDLVVAKEQKGL